VTVHLSSKEILQPRSRIGPKESRQVVLESKGKLSQRSKSSNNKCSSRRTIPRSRVAGTPISARSSRRDTHCSSSSCPTRQTWRTSLCGRQLCHRRQRPNRRSPISKCSCSSSRRPCSLSCRVDIGGQCPMGTILPCFLSLTSRKWFQRMST